MSLNGRGAGLGETKQQTGDLRLASQGGLEATAEAVFADMRVEGELVRKKRVSVPTLRNR